MKTIWLAPTALLITTGIACAQSATTSAPAPQGSVASPPVTSPGASPGNMAPASPGTGTMSMSGPASGSAGSATPAPNGAVSAPSVTAANAAPGKMKPSSTPSTLSTGSSSTMASASGAMAAGTATRRIYHHHYWSGSSMTLPGDASAATYLHIATSAIGHHNVALADDALSHAETRLLDRSVPQGQIAADDSPSIQSIESARKALHAGDYSQASADTNQAASAASGM